MYAQQHVALYATVGALVVSVGYLLPHFLFAVVSYVAQGVLFCHVVVQVCDLLLKHVVRWSVDVGKKAVLITGCDSGFGKRLAERLDRMGFRVFAGCLLPEGEGARALKVCGSERMQIVGLDVTKDGSVSEAFHFVKENLGTSELWAVVNNAGVCKTFQAEMTPMDVYNLCYQVNALGMVRVTKAFLPLLRKSHGRVVNVCSMAGRLPNYVACAYTMSKSAAISFTESLNLELQDFGVQAISIEPEYFKTHMCSSDNILSATQSCIDNSDPKVKEDYGEEYIKKCQWCAVHLHETASEKVEYVLDAMEQAICRRWPMTVYNPCRSVASSVVFYSLIRMNVELRAMLLHVLFSILGLEAPKTAKHSVRTVLQKYCIYPIKRFTSCS